MNEDEEQRNESGSEKENENEINEESDLFAFSCLNARSISNKSTALVDLFDEASISVSIITETWLRDSGNVRQRIEDLELGEDISMIRKDRGGRRGGGVAIAYNNKKMVLEEYELTGAKRGHEIVAATGRMISGGEKLFIVSIYLPPSMGRADVEGVTKIIADNHGRVKSNIPDVLIIVAGDFNKKRFLPALEDFPLIKKIATGPTRGRKTLDIIYTDFKTTEVLLLDPITTEDGVPSDHKTILCHSNLAPENVAASGSKYFFTQAITAKGREKFKNLIIETDWT